MISRKFNLLVSFLVLFFLVVNLAHAKKFPVGYPECWQDTKNPIILNIKSPDQFCPLNSKLGHKFFLVDFTSPLKEPQIDWISGRIFGNALVKETPPYHKISYMKIDNTAPQSQVISYSKCRFKTGNKSKFEGEQTNTGCEGEKQIAEVYTAWTSLTNKFENEFLNLDNKKSDNSLIFEYLFHVLREAKTDFTSEYPERELIIVSDLMQHSDRFSFYRHCKTNLELKKPNKCRTFEKLLKNKKVKNYIDDRKPKKETLTNLKVTILYINHDYETRDGLSSSLVALWEDLFKYIGVENYEIIKQLDIK
ncbi:hypothetical protein OAS12_01610 [Candidatus Pelagibacter ubique]|nr:hypothetical protein [Candidatus Pelagibacter ubique]